jgi:hypothetical protein
MDIQTSNIGSMSEEYLQKNGWNEWAKYVLMSLEELKTQHAESEDKIDANKDVFVQAVNSLELTVTKEIGELTAEIKVIKKQMALRSIVWSSIIPIISATIYALIKFMG